MGENDSYIHIPIFVAEIRELFLKQTVRHVWDGTTGEGGHSLMFLRENPQCRLLATDRDEQILAIAHQRCKDDSERVTFLHSNYSLVPDYLLRQGISLDFALLDLGISSFHLETHERGFSFRSEVLPDMRLDQSEAGSAAEVINRMPEKELAQIIWQYGEERKSRQIAAMIVKGRPWSSGRDLGDAIHRLMQRYQPKTRRKEAPERQIHPATRTFQGVRIYVNRELEHLRRVLVHLPKVIAPGGMVAIISFHSLEERLVKWFMRYWENPQALPSEYRTLLQGDRPGEIPMDLQHSLGKQIFRRPLEPSDEEVALNPRSRSARLRAFQFRVDTNS